MFHEKDASRNLETKTAFQEPGILLTELENISRVKILKSNHRRAEETGINLVEIMIGIFEDFEKRFSKNRQLSWRELQGLFPAEIHRRR